jgi:hypothetical protein
LAIEITNGLQCESGTQALMLHIIGVDHRVQARLPGADLNDGQQLFAQCLQAAIQKVQPILIAEEHSEEALKAPPPSRVSIAREIAGTIEHRFCDPPHDKRRAIGYKSAGDIEIEMSQQSRWDLPDEERRRDARAIEIGRYFPIREKFWLDCLTAKLCCEKEVLFVCGDVHIESGSFAKLLEQNHVPYKVVERRIGVAQDESYYKVLACLKEHPEVLDKPF